MEKEVSDSSHSKAVSQKAYGAKQKFIGILLAISLGIGLGVGLGVGLHNRDGSPGLPSNEAGTAAPSTTTSTPSPSPLPFAHGALKDTSLAAVSTSDGDRHVFFQDLNGTIRHTVFSVSSSEWPPTVDYVVTQEQPLNLTRITAIEVYPIGSIDNVPYINVYYVNTNGALAAAQYIAGSSPWSWGLASLINGSFPVSTPARSLSVTWLQSNATSPTNGSVAAADEVLLLYENPTKNITTLHGIYRFLENKTSETGSWVWQNVSDSFYPPSSALTTLHQTGCLGSPFSMTYLDNESFAYFFNPCSTYNDTRSIILGWQLGVNAASIPATSSLVTFSSDSLQEQIQNLDGFSAVSALSKDSDLILLQNQPALVVNETLYSV